MSNKFVDHTSSFIISNKKLLETGNFSDAILVVEDTEFTVHGVILASKSEFFEKLLYENQFIEGQQIKKTIEAPLSPFKLILEYMYTGTVDLAGQSEDDLLQILELSRRFFLPMLEDAIIDQLVGIVCIENWWVMLKTAELMESEKLKIKCWNTIAVKAEEFVASKYYLDFTEDQILYFFSLKNLLLLPIEKFLVISKWLETHEGYKDETKETLLATLHINRYTNYQLLKVIAPTKLFDSKILEEIVELRIKEEKEIIHEEVPSPESLLVPYHNFCTEEDGAQVIYGMLRENIFITTKSNKSKFYCTGICKDNEWRITLDLGSPRMIDYITFTLNKGKLADYNLYTSLSLDALYENEVGFFEKCSGEQRHYFDEVKEARYITITKEVECNAFKVYYLPLNPDIAHEISYKKTNPFTLEHAYTSLGGPGDRLLKYFKQKAMKRYRITIPPTGIEINFNQPTTLDFIRIRVWDFGTGQDFELQTIRSDGYVIDTFRRLNVFGWQVFELCRGPIYHGIKITPLNKDKELILAHVEGAIKLHNLCAECEMEYY